MNNIIAAAQPNRNDVDVFFQDILILILHKHTSFLIC